MEEKMIGRIGAGTGPDRPGRNEPCPCGSKKKYKRCCGIGAAPQLGTPKSPLSSLSAQNAGALPGGIDPSQLDPQWMMQFSQALGRLPKGQMQRLQAIMQRAMAGKDVTRDAEDLERSLPPDFQALMQSFKLPESVTQTAGADGGAPEKMTEEQAKAIVAKAIESGQIAGDQMKQATALLESSTEAPVTGKNSKLSKFWKGLTSKEGK